MFIYKISFNVFLSFVFYMKIKFFFVFNNSKMRVLKIRRVKRFFRYFCSFMLIIMFFLILFYNVKTAFLTNFTIWLSQYSV